MKRRTLLVAVGASVSLAGCTSDSPPQTDTPSPTPTATTSTPTTPSLVEASLTPEPTDQCAAEETTVVFSELKIDVLGCVVGRNVCSGLRLSSARYDEDEDVVTLVIEAVDNRGPEEDCTGGSEPLGYRASLTYKHGVPGEIVVVHDDIDGRRTVVRATPTEGTEQNGG